MANSRGPASRQACAFISGPDGEGKPTRYGSRLALAYARLAGTTCLARRLAAARGVHLLSQRGQPDRADHHVGADDIARSPVESERLRELQTLLQGRAHLGARHVFFE